MGEEMFYTVAEAASALRLSQASVYRLVAKGRLGCHRPAPGGRKIVIRKRDIDAMMASCRGEVKQQMARKSVRYEELDD